MIKAVIEKCQIPLEFLGSSLTCYQKGLLDCDKCTKAKVYMHARKEKRREICKPRSLKGSMDSPSVWVL